MHPADIKAAIQKKGHTATSIASGLGLKPNAVSMIINGHAKSRRVACELSRILGVPVSSLFPGRYGNVSRRKAA